MTDINKLRQFLQVYNIDDTEYTDDQLQLMISQASSIIGDEFVSENNREDYVRNFEGTEYMTDFYPVLVDSVVVTVNTEEVTPHKITEEGIIYFTNHVQGEFSCSYVQAISSDEIEQTMFSVVMYMIREQNAGNIRSINEGDVSVTYDTDNTMSMGNQINNLIEQLRGKYKARVRLI